MQYVLDNSNILDGNVHETVIHETVNLDLSNLCKKDTSSLVFIQKYNEIKDEHSYCTPIYPDGSKDNDRVGCAAIINNISIEQRLPSKASIFTAEIKAIDLAQTPLMRVRMIISSFFFRFTLSTFISSK